MPLLRTLLWKAARHLANDPRVQQIAADAYDKAKPKVEQTARQIRDAAREASPLDDPVRIRPQREGPPQRARTDRCDAL